MDEHVGVPDLPGGAAQVGGVGEVALLAVEHVDAVARGLQRADDRAADRPGASRHDRGPPMTTPPKGTLGRMTGTGSNGRRDNVEQVYRRVREAILEGEIAPGAVMSQVALADELGVSRTPLREALRMLQSEGLVDAQANRRVTVRPISATDLEELVVMRVALETEAIRLSVERLQPEDIAALEGRLAEMAHFAEGQGLRALDAAAQRLPPRPHRARGRRASTRCCSSSPTTSSATGACTSRARRRRG